MTISACRLRAGSRARDDTRTGVSCVVGGIDFGLAIIAVSGATLDVGLPRLAGNREGMGELPGWNGRAGRAHRNMLQNLVLFAILVLVAHAINVCNAMSMLGAQLFFWSRVAHGSLGGVGHRPDTHLLAAGDVARTAPGRASIAAARAAVRYATRNIPGVVRAGCSPSCRWRTRNAYDVVGVSVAAGWQSTAARDQYPR